MRTMILDENTGVLTLYGKIDIEELQQYQNHSGVTSVVAAEDCVFPVGCSKMFTN